MHVRYMVWIGLIGICSASCAGVSAISSASTDSTTDTTSTTQEVSEIDNGQDIPADSVFAYTFSDDIDTATVTTDTLFLVLDESESAANVAAPIIANASESSSSACDNANAVSATVTCASQRRCVIQPASALAYEARYRICITTAVRYRSGDAFEGAQASFATATASDEAFSDYAGSNEQFSDETYTPPTMEAIDDNWGDPATTSTGLTLLNEYNAMTIPDDIHHLAVTFDPCPSNTALGVDGRQIKVPEQFTTIQKAVDAAKNYQTIVVNAQKTFTENVHISGKFVHIVSSSDTQEVDLQAKNSNLPVMRLDCGGGMLLRRFHLHGGTIGVKSDLTTKGLNTILESTIDDVNQGVVAHGGEIIISHNTIAANADAIDLIKTSGQVHANTIDLPGGIGVYLKYPLGVKVWLNTMDHGAGQGAVFVDGGLAQIFENTFNMDTQGFGVIVEYTPNTNKNMVQILENTIVNAEASGILIWGQGEEKTQASLIENSITGTSSSTSLQLKWLEYNSGGSKVDAFESGMGIVVLDAKVQTKNNTSSNNAHSGINYQRSCGDIDTNTANGNYYGIVSLASGDTDACDTPTLTNNSASGNTGQNIAADTGLSIPPAPEPVPPSAP